MTYQMPTQITISPATSEEAEALSRLICDNALHTLSGYYSPLQMETFLKYYAPAQVLDKIGHQLVFCAMQGGAIIGTVALEDDLIVGFYTHKDHLGKGVGTLLLRHIEQIALQNGFHEVQLSASPAARGYYLKQGFDEVSPCVFTYLGVDFDETFMRKQLK